MIIVSQDKMELVNFNTIQNIWICPDEEGRFTLEASADTNSTLGCYKTEERAKEILTEIAKEYSKYLELKGGPAILQGQIDIAPARAKEILTEIAKEYSKYLELKGGPAILQGQIDIAPAIFNIPKVYYMPKE